MAQDDWGPAEGLRQFAKRISDVYDRLNTPVRSPVRSEADRNANDAYRRGMISRVNKAMKERQERTRTEPSKRTTMTRTTSSRRGSRAR